MRWPLGAFTVAVASRLPCAAHVSRGLAELAFGSNSCEPDPAKRCAAQRHRGGTQRPSHAGLSGRSKNSSVSIFLPPPLGEGRGGGVATPKGLGFAHPQQPRRTVQPHSIQRRRAVCLWAAVEPRASTGGKGGSGPQLFEPKASSADPAFSEEQQRSPKDPRRQPPKDIPPTDASPHGRHDTTRHDTTKPSATTKAKSK